MRSEIYKGERPFRLARMCNNDKSGFSIGACAPQCPKYAAANRSLSTNSDGVPEAAI